MQEYKKKVGIVAGAVVISIGSFLIGGAAQRADGPSLLAGAANAQEIKITDDKRRPIDQQPIVITKTETKAVPVFSGSAIALKNQIDAVDKQILALQARKAELVSMQQAVNVELQKLPARQKLSTSTPF